MTTRLSKIVTGVAAAAALAISAVAMSSPAQAHWHGGWGHHGWGHHGWGWGGPIVVGAYDASSCGLVRVYGKSGRYLRTVYRCW